MSAHDLHAEVGPEHDGPVEEVPSAEEDEFIQAQVFQREMDHPEEFHSAIVDSLMGEMPDHDRIEVSEGEPLIEAEDEMIMAQAYQAQINEAEAHYAEKHPNA